MLPVYVNSRTLATHLLMQNTRHMSIKRIVMLPKRCSCMCSRRLSIHRLEESNNDSILNSRKSHQQNSDFLLKSNVVFLRHSTHNNSSTDDCQEEVNRKVGTLAATFVNNSASALQPYMKLMRIDKPIGINIFHVLTFMPD